MTEKLLTGTLSLNTNKNNSEFLLSELTDALSKAHDTYPGPDDKHYQLLKHLPVSTLLILLKIFNDIWKTGNITKSWKEATVIPISKPDRPYRSYKLPSHSVDELYMQNNGANDL